MSEEDKIQKFFRTYFTENKIKEDYAEKIIERAQQFQAKQKPKEFLGRFFEAIKKSYDPKNPKSFVNAGKRFLFVISKLLGEGKKQKQSRYPEIISSQIVQYYLFFFEIIFKNHLHELAVDLKMCRMRWVKLITDAAFIKMRQFYNQNVFRQEIIKKYKFNLDKGFSEENLQKIRKIHKKRGLNEKESNFYLGLYNEETFKAQTPKRQQTNYKQSSSQSSSSESDNENGQGTKKVKMDFVQPSSQNPMYPNYQTQPSYYSTAPNNYENPSFPSYSDPRFYRTSQNAYPYNNPPLNPLFQPNQMIYNQTLSNQQKYTYPQPSNLQPLTIPYQNLQKTAVTPNPYEFKQAKQQKKQHTSFQKIKKIREQLNKNLVKCRQCGQFFQNGSNHDKHMTEHFFSSLEKVNEAEVKGKIKKQNKIKLLDIKPWQSIDKPQQKQYVFEVLLSEVPIQKNERMLCFFCSQELQIAFSTKYEDWVYCDAVKINDEGQIGVIHFNCYECFKSEQDSPQEN